MLISSNPAAAVEAMQLSPLEIGLRLVFAMILGLIVGIEREYTHRPAGMRTHILVALGSCVVMLTGHMIFAQYYPYGATPDPARLAAQVIAGVGFLGAGTIMRDGASVKGLTTAASLWDDPLADDAQVIQVGLDASPTCCNPATMLPVRQIRRSSGYSSWA